MSSNLPVLLILGAGANIGRHVFRSIASKGYPITLTALSRPQMPTSNADGHNAALFCFSPDHKDPLSACRRRSTHRGVEGKYDERACCDKGSGEGMKETRCRCQEDVRIYKEQVELDRNFRHVDLRKGKECNKSCDHETGDELRRKRL